MPEIDRGDTQANILEGYRAKHVTHLFFRFEPGYGRSALEALSRHVTSAHREEGGAPEFICNLGISCEGLRALGLPEALLAKLPEAFRAGMRRRADILGDQPKEFDSDWEQAVHLWVWIQAREARVLRAQSKVVRDAASAGARFAFAMDGSALLDEQDNPLEHFGFRDSLSQPRVAGSASAMRPGSGVFEPGSGWRPIATGEFLLGHRDETGDAATAGVPEELTLNGTFAVVRKLEQDVAKFEAYIQLEAARLQAAGLQEASPEWIAERMVGRTRAGTPLTSSPLGAISFADDLDGRRCPLGAHIRRAHPRDGRQSGGSFARHRILRRGMPYGPAYAKDPEAKRGLLFVALNADFDRQFEFLQQRYMNDGAAVRQGTDPDPLLSPPGVEGNFVIPGDPHGERDTAICKSVPTFVTCRGGEYFFVPGFRSLGLLGQWASTPARAVSGIPASPHTVNSPLSDRAPARDKESLA